MPTSHHLAAAICAVAGAACFSADVAPCTATCASTSDCPAGLACTASGLCAATAATVCSAGPDGGPDGAGGTLDVTVRDINGLPAIGIRVLAALPDGTPVGDTTTGNDGTAIVPAPGVVDVTVAHTTGLGSDLTTILAAAPGDHLVFGPDPHGTATTQTVVWPSYSDTAMYTVASSCATTPAIVNDDAQPTQITDITLDSTCAGDHDVLITESDGTTLFNYLFAAHNAGPTVTLPGPWQPYASADANVTQLPAGVTVPGGLYLTASTVLRAGDLARGASILGVVTGGGGGANADIPLPPVGAGREVMTSMFHDDDGNRFQSIIERIPIAGEYNLGVEPAMVPWVTSPFVVDVSARTIRWSELDAGPSSGPGDMVAVTVDYSRGSTFITWRIVAPVTAVTTTGTPGEHQLALPDLPGSEPFELLPTDTLTARWLRIYGFTGADYAGVRGRAGAGLSDTADVLVETDTFFGDPAITRITRSYYKTL